MSAQKQEKTVTRGRGRPRAFDRKEVLCRALELFWRRGYEPTSVSELCSAMGINPASLYAEFGSKAALFLEAVTFYEHTYWDAPGDEFLREPDVFRAVEVFFARAAEILLSEETPCGCMVVLACVNIAEKETGIIRRIREMRQATRDMFAIRLQRAVEDGQLPEDTDTAVLACSLNTFLEGLSLQARDGLRLPELKAVARGAVRLLRRA